MDIWQELYEKARAQYGPQEVSPFVTRIMWSARWKAKTGEFIRASASKAARA